jgi:CheY-like chemotaxis protein
MISDVKTPEARATPSTRSRTVLLVEDDADLRYTARRTLQRLGYRVVVASDGDQALELCTEYAEVIDLVVSDAGLPTLGGAALYRALRARGNPVKFVLSSGRVSAAGDLSGEPVPFVLKPWNLDTLARVLEQVLAPQEVRSVTE